VKMQLLRVISVRINVQIKLILSARLKQSKYNVQKCTEKSIISRITTKAKLSNLATSLISSSNSIMKTIELWLELPIHRS
jgi:hypothetical protein